LTTIFIHGAGANRSVWRLQTVHFPDSLAIELPGHPIGPSLATISDYAQVVERQISEKGISKPVIVGHSMGGAIAIDFALRNYSLAGLVLVGTGARLRVRAEFLVKIKENYLEAAKLLASWSVSASADPIISERMVQDLMKVKPEVTLGDFIACNKFDRMDRVGEIACRTLIICGEDDVMTPKKYSEFLHERIKNSQLTVISGAGHSVMLEKPREFNRTLGAFLASM